MSINGKEMSAKLNRGSDSVQRLVRHAFEKWISSPPYEREIERWPQDETKHSWPGQYKDIAVEVAWDSWQEASKESASLREILNACRERVFGTTYHMGDDLLHILSNITITNPSPSTEKNNE